LCVEDGYQAVELEAPIVAAAVADDL